MEPLNYVLRVSPRPLFMLSGAEDETTPLRCSRLLHESAREPKTIRWLPVGHVKTRDPKFHGRVPQTSMDWLAEIGSMTEDTTMTWGAGHDGRRVSRSQSLDCTLPIMRLVYSSTTSSGILEAPSVLKICRWHPAAEPGCPICHGGPEPATLSWPDRPRIKRQSQLRTREGAMVRTPLEYRREIAQGTDHEIVVFTLFGDLCGRTRSYELQDEVRSAVASGSRWIVVDLAAVPKIDSAGVGILASLMWSASQAGGGLVMVAVPSKIEKVLEIAMLLDRIDHADSVQEAIGILDRE
jgi:anti-anti-sigma factor